MVLRHHLLAVGMGSGRSARDLEISVAIVKMNSAFDNLTDGQTRIKLKSKGHFNGGVNIHMSYK